ncbi:hypothetical protein, partial [Peribacillus frigoritolerans]|uniref:hypothetical protein n=1 Tax=Peribacillus frigoritolerans TaxID=450367 RepID=UPI0024173038
MIDIFNVFDKEIYDTKKLKQTEFEKGKHKEAWNKWGYIIKQTISKVDNDFKVVPHRWIIGQYLLQYFWFELKH